MSVLCPYCQHEITLKGAKPGRYTPKCPKCVRAFVLTVPDKPGQAMSAAPLKAAPAGAKPAPTNPAPTKPAPAATTANPAKRPAPAKPAAPARPPAKPRLEQTIATDDSLAPRSQALGETIAPDEIPTPRKAAAKPAAAPKPTPRDPLDQTVAPEDAAPAAPTRPPAPATKKTIPPRTAGATQAPPSKPVRRSNPLELTVPEPDADAPIGATGEWQRPATEGGAADGTEVWEGDAASEDSKPTVAAAKKGTKADAKDKTRQGKDDNTNFETDGDIPEALGGYQIVKQLGQGGMGTVYLARQMSLDRHVALKVMNPQWAAKPTFLARFTREAYAAAQLVHHHIVQIYDIGADLDMPFFSMEFVKGQHLGEVLKDNGPLDIEMAVGYILQAARGLKFAHDQGMVHRDIKPDNLMLNDQGLVKVADLGLVKTPGAVAAEDQVGTEAPSGEKSETGNPQSENKTPKTPAPRPGSKLSEVSGVTAVGVAMGTPAFMAPEQGRNAALVDHRADIYSLGCTLYVLLTGRPPFQGKTAIEVITKHFNEPIVRPEAIVKRVPRELSDILMKMMAKKPEDRQQDMAAVISDLENFLGIQRTGPFTPREEHANLLEESVKQFNDVPAARLRKRVGLGFLAACGLGVLVTAIIGYPGLAGGFLGLALMTALFTFLVNGVTFKTHLFLKSRELIFCSSWSDWLTWSVSLVLIVLVLYFLGLLWYWLGFMVLAVLLAGAYHVLIERKALAQRQPAMDKLDGLLRAMRLGGLEEDAIRMFVCKYAGDRWEPLYEAAFGYDYLLQARQHWAKAGTGKRRPQHASWRDPIILWIDARQKAVKEAREKKHLLKVEQKQLEAQGLKGAEARAKAAQVAEALVVQAAEIKQQAAEVQDHAGAAPATASPRPRKSVGDMLQNVGKAAAAPAPRRRVGPGLIKSTRNLLFGLRTRFLLGVALLGLGLAWLRLAANRPLADQVVDLFTRFRWPDQWADHVPFAVFQFPPEALGSLLFNSFNPAVAGLLILVSTFFMSWKAIGGFYVGGLVVFLGQMVLTMMGMPRIEVPMWGPVSAEVVSLLAGTGLAVVGFLASALMDKE